MQDLEVQGGTWALGSQVWIQPLLTPAPVALASQGLVIPEQNSPARPHQIPGPQCLPDVSDSWQSSLLGLCSSAYRVLPTWFWVEIPLLLCFILESPPNNKGNCSWNLGNLKKVEHRSSGLRQPLVMLPPLCSGHFIYTHSYIVYLFTFFVWFFETCKAAWP